MKYELKIEADTVEELLGLFNNLKDRPINEIPKANKVTVELADESAPEPEPAEEAGPTVKLEDVQRVFKDKMTSGADKRHLREILSHYGASKVSALDPKDYDAVLQELQLVEA